VLLLFPKMEHDYTQWFRDNGRDGEWQKRLVADTYETEYNTALECRKVEGFPVWGPRLLQVQKSPSQEKNVIKKWWKDDRDESLWITRWSLIAAVFLTILFGLTQSITGIIQVVYAAPSAG
jgi:hypothetical protein